MSGGDASDDGSAPTLAGLPRDAEATLLAIGARIGRYELVERLGAGAMGVVWSATDPQLDRVVAIKLVHPAVARQPDAASRLLREARAMAKLSHRAVVTVHDAGETDGQLFVAMELVRGSTLGAQLRTRSPEERADWKRWFTAMREAGRGLAAAHDASVLHRDFKPDNVLVGTGGRVCVADFGLATLGGVVDEAPGRAATPLFPDVNLTATGALLGTPAYMSLEQLRGFPADTRSDQFAFCVAMWEALYGARPFTTDALGMDAVVQLAETIAAGPPPVPDAAPAPAQIGEVLRRGMAAEPDARWPDMAALLDALDAAAATDSMPGGIPSPLDTLPIARESRSVPWVVAGLAGAIVVVAVLIVVLSRRAEPVRVATPAPTVPTAPVAPPPAGIPMLPSQRLFDLPVQAALALSPDGTRLAIGDQGVEVRMLVPVVAGQPSTWRHLDPEARRAHSVAFDGANVVRYAMSPPDTRRRWNYETDTVTTEVEAGPFVWIGTAARGELYYDTDLHAFHVLEGDQDVHAWVAESPVAVMGISPNGKRVAYVQEERNEGRLVIHDVTTGDVIISDPITELTTLGWRDDTTLVYAQNTQFEPTISRISVTDRLGPPTAIHQQPLGWISRLLAHGDTMYAVEVDTIPKTRVVELKSARGRDLDPASASAVIAWIDEDTFYTWNSRSDRIDIRDINAPRAQTAMVLDGEPANATLTPDVLMAAVRRKGGRELIAWSRATEKVLWTKPVGAMMTVRCAGDRAAPCFALVLDGKTNHVQPIDPATGTMGAAIASGVFEDLAVSPDGTEVALGGKNSRMTFVDVATHAVRTERAVLSVVRSLAYMPKGGFLLAGTISGTTYDFGVLDAAGKYASIDTRDGEVLMLARPAPSGTRATILGRVYNSALFRLGSP